MGILATIGAASQSISIAGSVISLAQATKTLVSSKKFPPGIQGFLFDIPETANVIHAAQITDHWIEDNSAVQDHIAIEPIKISLTGKVAELVYTKTQAQEYAEVVLNNLGPLGALTPELALEAQRAISAAAQLKQAVDSVLTQAKTLTGLFAGTNVGLNKQQIAYKTFIDIFDNRGLVTVETPWKTYDNMAIESFESTQDETTTTMSTFTVNFKQLRTVSATINTGKLQGRAKAQKAPVVNKGQQQGQSALTTITGFGK